MSKISEKINQPKKNRWTLWRNRYFKRENYLPRLQQINFLLILFYFTAAHINGAEQPVDYFRSKGLYVQGAEYCKKLLNQNIDVAKRKELLLELANCYQFNTRDHTYQLAVEICQQFIKAYPQDPLCAKAYFNIGRCYDLFTVERSQDIEKAREAYQTCYEKYPDSQWADQAYFWHANSYIYKLTPATAAIAVRLFNKFIKRYPQSPLLGVVHSQLSELYCTWLENYKLAISHSEHALQYGIQDIKLRQSHFYRLAYLYQFKLKDNKNAIKWYQRLIKDSPLKTDPNYFVAQKRLDELQLLTGTNK